MGLQNLDAILQKVLNINISNIPGAGAAGAMGAGCMAFLGAELSSGIQFIIDVSGLEEKIKMSDIVITGEGCIDDQSTQGKVVSGIAHLCQKHQKPLILVGGIATISEKNLNKLHPKSLFTIKTEGMTKEEAMRDVGKRLIEIGQEIAP